MIPDFHAQQRTQNGLTPAEYRRHLEAECARARQADPASLDEYMKYLPLNLQRTKRIERTYRISPALEEAVRAVNTRQLWMVLTEAWCGDSAQNLPYIVKIAACSPAIDLKILLRDQNPDIMNAYLTNGARSIPKLIAFDLMGNELFRWGPRPLPAAELFHRLREAGVPAEEVKWKLHLWYARNRGRALEEEFAILLKTD